MTSVKILLKTGKTYKDGTHPVVLRIIHLRKQKVITLGITATSDEWVFKNNLFSEETKELEKKNSTKNDALRKIKEKAKNIILEIERDDKVFSFELFEYEFRKKKAQSMSLFKMFDIYINELDKKDKVSTRDIYKNTLNVIKTFRKNKDLSLYGVNYEFLKDFETFLFGKGNTGGGVKHHMRNLRTIVNEAIRRSYMQATHYPFSTQFNKSGYSLSHLKSVATPRALSQIDLEALKSFDINKHPDLQYTYDLFMFSYYGRGINYSDMANLKKSNLYDGRIPYIRLKTGKSINLKNSEKLREIINRYWDENNEYLFPILNKFHQTNQQKYDRIRKCRKKFNKELKKIASLINIKIELTSYVARHSFATALLRNRVGTELIGEALAHSEYKVTKSYLEPFSNEEIDKLDELL